MCTIPLIHHASWQAQTSTGWVSRGPISYIPGRKCTDASKKVRLTPKLCFLLEGRECICTQCITRRSNDDDKQGEQLPLTAHYILLTSQQAVSSKLNKHKYKPRCCDQSKKGKILAESE